MVIAILASVLLAVRGGAYERVDLSAGDDNAIIAARGVDAFFDTFVTFDGRVVRRDEGGDTVSEGQAYAMLMSAAVGDARRFERVWSWTQSNLQRPDGLLSWRWRHGRVVDEQPASDADVDVARALLVASSRFHERRYERDASRLLESILRREIGRLPSGDGVLVAGPWARDPVVINPSYFSPAAFDLFFAATGDGRWRALSESSDDVLETLTRRPRRLPPDWAVVRDGRLVASSPPDTSEQPLFGFDAARVVIRSAEDCEARGSRIAASMWPMLGPAARHPRPLRLDGSPTAEPMHPVVLVAAAASAHASGDSDERDALLDRAEQFNDREPTYYGAAWVVLGRIMLQTSLLGPCPRAS